ncbi:hypothetical protein V4F39_07880, partial [Aquincola sp. MAHUQ-54]
MSRQQRVVFDVPDERVDFVVAMMRADGAETSRQRQPDGRWTVTGRFPEPAPTPAPDPAPTPAAGPPAPTGPRPAGP